MRGGRIQFGAVCVRIANDIARKFHDGELHAKTQTQERDLVFACISDSLNLALDTAGAEAAWNQNAADISEKLTDILRCYSFRVDPFDVDAGTICNTAML